VLIRPATPDDARGIAVVHIRSWQAAYRGLMPQPVLDDLTVTGSEKRWRSNLQPHRRGDGPRSRTLVAEVDGRILGWASFGDPREDEIADAGELWGIYAHPDAYGAGVGHALIAAVEQALQADGHPVAYLWVLDGNERAATFYERHGWLADGATKVEERPHLRLFERRRVKQLG
jgi:GNAT superfamily N-acetyltransferase